MATFDMFDTFVGVNFDVYTIISVIVDNNSSFLLPVIAISEHTPLSSTTALILSLNMNHVDYISAIATYLESIVTCYSQSSIFDQ